MKIRANGIELAYEKTGMGEPMLLLHGNGEDHHIFDTLSQKLLQQFTLYAIDSRNHGESTKTDEYSYDVMAEDIAAFIEALGLDSVDIVGFSDGAIIALLLAMKGCRAIRKMALLGVNLKPEDFTEESYQFVKETYEETKDPLFKLMLEEPNISPKNVKNIAVPTLVVAGENDIFKPETFVTLSKALPDGQLLVMEGHEHDSYLVGQDCLYPELIRFFG